MCRILCALILLGLPHAAAVCGDSLDSFPDPFLIPTGARVVETESSGGNTGYPLLPEVVVRLSLRGVGEMDIVALQQNSELYVPVLGLFSFLHINAVSAEDLSKVTGYYIDSDRLYEIRTRENVIILGERLHRIDSTRFVTAFSDIYLTLDVYREVFGIELVFDPIQLYVHIQSSNVFPIERIQRGKRSRPTVTPLEMKPADVEYERDRQLLSGGMLDWRVDWSGNSTTADQPSAIVKTGFELLGGDFIGTFSVSAGEVISWSTIPWRWRYVAESPPFFRSSTVGWLTNSFGSLYGLRGVSIGSGRVMRRRHFGFRDYYGIANPGDEVELYSRGRLINLTSADSTGRFTFKLPLNHGGNQFNVRTMDKHGIIRSSEVQIEIPFGMLHAGETEYRISTGEVQFYPGSYLLEGWAKIGVGDRLNVGGGLQATRRTTMNVYPLLFANWILSDDVLLEVAHLQGSVSKVQASMKTTSDLTFRGAYSRWEGGLFQDFASQYEEIRGSVAFPVLKYPIRAWTAIFGQSRWNELSTTYSMISQIGADLNRISALLTTNARWDDRSGNQNVSNVLSVNGNVLREFTIRGGITYSHYFRRLSSAHLIGDWSITRNVVFRAGWVGNLMRGGSEFNASLSLRLPEIRLESRGQYFPALDHLQFQSSASGSIGYDEPLSTFHIFNQSWVDRSALTLIPFIDDNASGTYEDGELLLDTPVQAWLDRGQRYRGATDDHTRFVNLDQYDTYRVSLDQAGFVDPVWVPMYREIDVVADPNRFKAVYLPVYLGGEVQGSVMHMAEGVTRPQRGVRVLFHRLDRAQQDVQTNTYLDGSFQYFGLAPGRYSAAPDTVQLAALGYRSEPPQREFTVRSKESGDLVEGIDFLLYRSALPPGDTLGPIVEERVERLPDTAIIVVPPIAQLDTVKTPPTVQPDERPEIVARDTAAVAFVPLPFGSSRSIPINLATSGIDSASQAWIDRLVETVRDLRNYTVVVEGHADNFGSFQENQQRSEQRAQRILQLLTDRGVPRDRIQVQSFGSRRPVAPNTSAEGRRRNNRADVKLLGTGAAQPSRPMRQQETPRPPTSERAVDSLVFRPPDVVDPAQGSTAASVVLEIEHSGGALDAASRRNIEGLLRVLREQPRAVLQIEGHSDNFGSMEASQQRSQARADRVLAHVLAQGITRERVQVRAFGSRRPVASNRTAEGRRQNNRVELRVIVP